MLKVGSKAIKAGRKRKRHEVFDMGAPADVNIHEEKKEKPPAMQETSEFKDVTGDLRPSKRNRTQNNYN